MTISSTSGLGAGAPSPQASPAATLRELVAALSEQRRTQLDQELSIADEALAAASARAAHAAERADAMRGHAALQLAIGLGSSCLSALAADRTRAGDRNGAERLEAYGRVFGEAGGAALAADEAFGLEGRARGLAARMERDAAQGEQARTRAEQVATKRQQTEDALADARRCYRDVLHGKDGE